ncbi:host attachment protein [Sphingopyxis terrae]
MLVIADPHTLGVMRGHYHRELEKRLVGELAKTLTNADTAQIEQAIGAA